MEDENEAGSSWAGPDMSGILWGFHSRAEPEHHLLTEVSRLGEKLDRHLHKHGDIGDI